MQSVFNIQGTKENFKKNVTPHSMIVDKINQILKIENDILFENDNRNTNAAKYYR